MRRALVLVLLFWVGALPTHAQTAPYTLAELLQLMRQHNPALRAAQQHVSATEANQITAGLRPNPVLSSSNEDFQPGSLSWATIRGAQEFTENIAQLLERGGKRELRVENAAHATRVARDNYSDAVRQAELQVKLAYTALLLAVSNLQLVQQNLADYQRIVDASRVRMQAGDISPTEFDRIQLEQVRFETDVLAAQEAVTRARVQVENAIGLPPNGTIEVAGDLQPPAIEPSLEELNRLALEHRPDYLAAQESVSLADSAVRLADANGTADPLVGAEYKRNGIENTFGVTLQLPLRIFDRNQGEKLRTRYELAASRSSEAAMRLRVLAEVRQAWEAYQAALSRARLYSVQYANLARSVRDRVEFSFRNGGTSLLDYLDVVRAYRNTELAARGAQADVLTAIHQLSFASATELLP